MIEGDLRCIEFAQAIDQAVQECGLIEIEMNPEFGDHWARFEGGRVELGQAAFESFSAYLKQLSAWN